MQENDDNNDHQSRFLEASLVCKRTASLKICRDGKSTPSLLGEKSTPHPWTSRASGDPRNFGGSDPTNELKCLTTFLLTKLLWIHTN